MNTQKNIGWKYKQEGQTKGGREGETDYLTEKERIKVIEGPTDKGRE